MRIPTLAATTLALAVSAAAVAAAETAAAQRSTANTETRVAAPAPAATPAPPAAPVEVKPQEPVHVAFAAHETRKLVEGKASAASPAVVLWAAPNGRMLNAQLMTQGDVASLVIYQPGADKPDAGATLADGAIRWIGESTKPGELKLEVHPKGTAEIAFKLGLEVTPAEDAKK